MFLHAVDTAACLRQTRHLHSICGRRNGITLLTSFLKCLQISRVMRDCLVNAILYH